MSRLILVPLDGSEFSESALAVALSIARRWEARLEVLTVHEAVPTLDHDLWETASREWSEKYIASVAERIKEEAGGTVASTALSGTTSEAIQHHVEARGGDLVVMATHGRGPMSRFWLGSTADALVRHSSFPILLLRPTEGATLKPTEDFSPKKVLVPLDGSRESEAILTHALEIADDPEEMVSLLPRLPLPRRVRLLIPSAYDSGKRGVAKGGRGRREGVHRRPSRCPQRAWDRCVRPRLRGRESGGGDSPLRGTHRRRHDRDVDAWPRGGIAHVAR